MVAYLFERFDIQKPVIIIRHPCAVVASQRRFLGWKDYNNHPYIDSELLYSYTNIKKVIKKATHLEEKLAITWACDTLAALRYPDSVQIVFYENLVLNGAEELKKIFGVWGAEVPQSCLDKLLEYSSTRMQGTANLQGYAKLEEWCKHLSNESIGRILNCVCETGVAIYNKNSHHIPTLGQQ